MASLRRLVLVLMAILTRPWFWLMLLALCVGPGLALQAPVADRSTAFPPIAVVPGPTVRPNGGEGVREDQLATITEWHALWTPQFVSTPGGGTRLVENDRDSSEQRGDWDILDQLPAVERLGMTAPDTLSGEGWRRIGDRGHLELLSLWYVGSSYGKGDDAFARDGRDALARLRRLKHLQLLVTDVRVGVLLPPLPALEACVIGVTHLEENLATLAAGSPRLHSLALDTYPAFEFTPGMIASLRKMPALRTIYVAGGIRPDKEESTTRQVAALARELPEVRVRPGWYSGDRVRAVGAAAMVLAGISWVFWLQAATLLATSLAWMLPRRFSPHAVWPAAVAAAGSTAFFMFCRSLGVAWLPALGLALFACGVGLYGPVLSDMAGWPARLTRLAMMADVVICLLIVGTWFGAPATADVWLTGYEPQAAVALACVAAASLGWKIARVARLPRILADGGWESTLVGSFGGGLMSSPAAVRSPGDRRDLSWRLNDAAIDRQLARPPRAASPSAAWFADMVHRSQSHLAVPLIVGVIFAVTLILGWTKVVAVGESPLRFGQGIPLLFVNAAGQATLLSILMMGGLWWQRHSSLTLDFLRPVSRRDYWLGLRAAVARDLVLPFVIVAASLIVAASSWGHGRLLPWVVSGLAFPGLVAVTHAMLLHITTARGSIVTPTIAGIVIIAAALGLMWVVGVPLIPVRPDEDATGLMAMAGVGAAALLVAGLVIRAAVLSRLEDREIG